MFSGIGNLCRILLFCLDPSVCLLPKTLKLFGFAIMNIPDYRIWSYAQNLTIFTCLLPTLYGQKIVYISQIRSSQIILGSLEASIPKGLSRIAKFDKDYLCLKTLTLILISYVMQKL
jgi:hypothetical protein